MLDLSSLNPEQHRAVTHIKGPLLVLAGAGSGKTRVITYRVGHLIHCGVSPKRILALSFTNKAAGEMRERVGLMVGRDAKHVTCSTFHALGLKFLRAEAELIGLQPGFTILDEGDQRDAVKMALESLGFDLEKYDPRQVHTRVSHFKGTMTEPNRAYGGIEAVAFHVLPLYEQRLRAMNAVDFDDLICLPVLTMERNEPVGKRWAARYDHIMVDEYQDTNSAQLRMIRALAKRSDNVCVVGDDDQSIYAFRGAVAGNILRFPKDFPGAKTVALTQNYRSTNNILKAANQVISNNAERHEKALWSQHGDGPLLRYRELDNDEAEARWIATDLLGAKARLNLKWEDFAVLYRTNAQSRVIEHMLREARIPYRLVGGTRFYDRKEVKDVVAYLRVVANPYDEAAYRRIVNYPMRGIGDSSIQRIGERATELGEPFWRVVKYPDQVPGLATRVQSALVALDAKLLEFRALFAANPLAEACRAMIKALNFDDALVRAHKGDARQVRRRLDDIEEVASALQAYTEFRPGATLSDYTASLALDSRRQEDGDEDEDMVRMMTLHASKGLEFTAVYLSGVEEGLMPHKRVLDGDGDLAEERRLAYVGITRAKRHLVLSGAEKRLKFGRVQRRKPSRFLEEIPDALFEGGRPGAVVEMTEAQKETHAQDAFAAMGSLWGDG